MDDNSILLAFSHQLNESKYEVNRNYFYLCGVIEYENIVLLSKINGKENEMIFINPYDEFKAKWVGAPLSVDEVLNISGIANIYYLDNFDNGSDLIYCANQTDSIEDISKYFGVDTTNLVKYNNITDNKIADTQAIVNPSVESMDVFNKNYLFEIDNQKTRAY